MGRRIRRAAVLKSASTAESADSRPRSRTDRRTESQGLGGGSPARSDRSLWMAGLAAEMRRICSPWFSRARAQPRDHKAALAQSPGARPDTHGRPQGQSRLRSRPRRPGGTDLFVWHSGRARAKALPTLSVITLGFNSWGNSTLEELARCEVWVGAPSPFGCSGVSPCGARRRPQRRCSTAASSSSATTAGVDMAQPDG